MWWLPTGPDFVFAPRDQNFRRLSRRDENGRQGLVARIAIEPGSLGRTMYTIVRPSNGGVVLYRGDNAGTPIEQWASLVDGLQQGNPRVDPSWVAINPTTPSTIFMATYDDQSVYVSIDRGRTWGPRQYVGGRIKKLVIDPRTAGNPTGTVIYAATDAGVFRSADSGSSWINVLAGDVWSFCASMPPAGPDAYCAGVMRAGLLSTANPLAAWTNLNAAGIGLPAHNPGGGGASENFNVVYADICPLNPSRLYLLTFRPNSPTDGTPVFGSLYTTSNPAATWSTVATVSPPQPAYGFYYFFGIYDFAFAVSPNSPGDGATDILFFGGLGFSRSTDAGRTWQTPPDILHADHHAFVFYPEAPPAGTIPKVYIGCDGGLALSNGYCNPAVNITTAPPDFDELTTYTDTPVVQNVDHAISSVALYSYSSSPALSALQYTAAQDTGVSAGVMTGGRRGIADADATQVACAPGADGVKVWVDLGQYNSWPEYRVLMFTDKGNYAPGSVFVIYPPSGSPVEAHSRLVVAPDNTCVLGMVTLDAGTTLTSAIGSGVQVVTPVSMTGISTGMTLDVGGEFVIVTATTATTFTANFGSAHAAGTTVQSARATVGRLDQSGGAARISQNFGLNGVQVETVAVGPSGTDVGYCATSDNRVWQTSPLSTANAGTVWSEVATGRPVAVRISAIAIGAAGDVYVLAPYPVTAGGTSTSLFAIGSGSWVAQPCVGVPSGYMLGPMVADPVRAGVLYAASGARVYKLTIAAGTWTWTDISDNLPGQWIYDMWIANVGTPATPKIMLRVGIPTRGVWEVDVTSAPSDPPITLYLRDNFLDQGIFPNSPDGIPSPYAPTDPGQVAYHYMSADIKVDARQPATGGSPAFFQTDPEGGVVPISHVAFDALADNSENLPQTDAARVHVQIHNRSLTPANNALVWAVYANASGHVPSLSASPSMGNAFPFWSQFQLAGGVASIVPNLPADSPWTAVGPPIVLSGVDAAHPQVATWNWSVPLLSTGDPGHFCMVAFVHSADNPLAETAMDVDTITPRNRTIAQKNLHIGAPLSPGPAGAGPKDLKEIAEYIEFNNPLREEELFDFLFDLRGLPKELEVRVQFTKLATLEPLDRSIHGMARKHKGGQPPRANKFPERRRIIELPEFDTEIYEAHPAGRLQVNGVRMPPMGRAAAFLTIRNRGTLEPGSEYSFAVRQIDPRGTQGGGTYVVRIAGERKRQRSFVAPSHDYYLLRKNGVKVIDADPTSLPRWIRYQINAQRRNEVGDVIE
jgi:hypothetical protein